MLTRAQGKEREEQNILMQPVGIYRDRLYVVGSLSDPVSMAMDRFQFLL